MVFIDVAATLLIALILGGMVFFAGVVAPMVFKALTPDAAGAFLRAFFPLYYKVLAAASGVAAVLLSVAISVWTAALMLIVAGLFAFSLMILTPRINDARDAWLCGDSAARIRFGRLHGASVAINLAQMIIVLVVFLALTTPWFRI